MNLATLDIAALDDRESIAQLERALSIFARHEGWQAGEPEAHVALADALLRRGGDRERARQLLQSAREGYEKSGGDLTEELVAVERRLADGR
jgi:hypothetical protein